MPKVGLFKDKYRIESTRLKEWDYSSPGYYFVTMCTQNRECAFGEIVNGQMQLSSIGKIVAEEWQKTEQIRENIELDEWIIMPNHIHAIVVIEDDKKNNVETHCNASLQINKNNLSYIIRGFKSSATKRIRTSGHTDFSWQSRFYDHVIRNENSLEQIREYIHNNALKWDTDEDNPAVFLK
jgi:REP element-mobilizing transposase RayT